MGGKSWHEFPKCCTERSLGGLRAHHPMDVSHHFVLLLRKFVCLIIARSIKFAIFCPMFLTEFQLITFPGIIKVIFSVLGSIEAKMVIVPICCEPQQCLLHHVLSEKGTCCQQLLSTNYKTRKVLSQNAQKVFPHQESQYPLSRRGLD